MSEDADIEILPPHEEASKPKRHIGLKTLGVGVIIASLLGASGGAMLSKFMQEPTLDISPLMTNIEALQSENKTLKAQVARLQRDIKAMPKPAAMDVSSIEVRIEALERAKPQEINEELVARLEALKEEGSEALDLSGITARLEALEARPQAVAPINVLPALSNSATPTPFPREAVLTALESLQPSGGWLKRSLKKHISVQSDDNPNYLMELIVQSLEDGNIEAALTAFDKLPAEAKAAAAGWRESVTN